MAEPEEPAALRGERLVRFVPPTVFVLLPLILVLPGLRPGRFLFGQDVVGNFYYLRGEIGKSLAGGRLPVWDDHTMCGAPRLATLHAAVLYPLTWPSAFIPPGLFWTLTAAIHLALAGFFAYAWLSRGLGLGRWAALAGGVTFMLSGFIVTHLYAGHIPHVSSYPWAAALLWRTERWLAGPTLRRFLLLAVSLALMILAGFPHFVLIAGLAVAARLVHFALEKKEGRKARARVALQAAGALAAGVLIAAPQLLPTLELLRETQRTAVKTYEFATTYSLAPESLLALVAPTFFGDDRGVPYWGRWFAWELTGFVSIAGLALAVLGGLGRRPQRLWDPLESTCRHASLSIL